jgi:mannose-6-phosphate isomerase-like protein (cupin superfamily)
MPEHFKKPTVVGAAGNKPKIIEEFIGLANSGTDEVSIARMKSPEGWIEPGQTPRFDEYSVVLKGMLRVTTRKAATDVKGGEAILVKKGEWVQYSTPESGGAEYIAVCVPAFSMERVNRE